MTKIFTLWILIFIKTSFGIHDGPPKVAIIGGGIAGTSTAYFLKEHFADDVLLDIYETEEIGGRLATVPIGTYTYEVGGTVIHPKNEYMVKFASLFGLAKRKFCGGHFGLFNGDEYVFKDSSWSVVTLAKLFWRYGYDIYHLNEVNKEMLNNFARIYKLQAQGNAYEDLESLLSAMDPRFVEMTKSSTASWLKNLGFSDLIINELITAAIQANYGQTPNLHAFVGSIAVAGADSSLWAIAGGNKQVPEKFLESSKAALLKRYVTEISFNDNGPFTVTSVEAETSGNHLFEEGTHSSNSYNEEELPRSQEYDIVIVATPLTKDKTNIKFRNFTEEFKFLGNYERIVCTMVQGKIRPAALKLSDEDELDEILITNPKLIFNALGKQQPIDEDSCSDDIPDVWKIFSPNPLPKDQLDMLFIRRNSTTVIDWLAYPHYESSQPLPSFVLVPGLYHVNAIEWAGSAMEMEVIGAKNAALLAYKYWKKHTGTQERIVKDEL